ncbi:MAG: alginate lyase family protein [Bacteroidales bacterium]
MLYPHSFTGLFFFIISLPSIGQPVYPNSPEPWREAYEIKLEGFEFTHPMTVINREELELIKKRILYGVEPQSSAVAMLLSDAGESLEFTPNAPKSLEIPGGYVDGDGLQYARDLLWANCHAAYSCALAYALTGDTLYAEKTREVLMNWANTATVFYGDDAGLQLGSWFSPMLYGADLIHDYQGWSVEERTTFKSWWKNNVVLDGDVLGVLRRKDNNWKDAALLGTMAASIILEDTLLLKEALIQLKSYFYGRNDNNVQLPGTGWKITSDERGVYLPREVVRVEGRKGLTYTAYALTTMSQALEIARNAGFNYWRDSTQQGVTLGDLIWQYYRWDVMDETFPWNSNPDKSDKRRNTYELAANYFDFPDSFDDYLRKSRPVIGREGDEFATLTKGDMNGWDTLTMTAAPELQVTALSATQIALEWSDLPDREYGFRIERKEDTVFKEIALTGPGTTAYIDTGLVSSTEYIYRIVRFNASAHEVFSNQDSAITYDSPAAPPQVPGNLSAEKISPTSILLSWTDNSVTEEGFLIERRSGGEFEKIGTAGVNDTEFLDEDVMEGGVYTYRIQAYNTAGPSDYSNEVDIITAFEGGIFVEQGGVVSMEAEHGQMGAYWEVKSGQDASGGAFIEIGSDKHTTEDLPECEDPVCIVTYYFKVSLMGNYRFWFRTLSEGGEDDSFFWRIGIQDWVRENGRAFPGSWFETQNIQLENLSFGTNILEIAYREDGTQIDKFIIQLEGMELPAENGSPESAYISPAPPDKPYQLDAKLTDPDEIYLNWVHDSGDLSGFKVKRKEADEFAELARTGPFIWEYTDMGLEGSTIYTYTVQAYNASGNSNYATSASAMTGIINGAGEVSSTQIHGRNYPNPFSDKTWFHYSLSERSEVKLNVYNSQGQKVKQLVDSIKEAGSYSTTWDGTDQEGRGVSRGLYFCRLQHSSSIHVFKVVYTGAKDEI